MAGNRKNRRKEIQKRRREAGELPKPKPRRVAVIAHPDRPNTALAVLAALFSKGNDRDS